MTGLALLVIWAFPIPPVRTRVPYRWQDAATSEEYEFGRDPVRPAKTGANRILRPDERCRVTESPGFHHVKSGIEKTARCPKIEMRVIGRELAYIERANLVERHR